MSTAACKHVVPATFNEPKDVAPETPKDPQIATDLTPAEVDEATKTS